MEVISGTGGGEEKYICTVSNNKREPFGNKKALPKV